MVALDGAAVHGGTGVYSLHNCNRRENQALSRAVNFMLNWHLRAAGQSPAQEGTDWSVGFASATLVG